MNLSDIIRKAMRESASAPSLQTDVWQDIIWELEVLADRSQMLADRCRRMARWIKDMPRRDERRRELLEYLLREGCGGEPTLEGFERIAGVEQEPKAVPKRKEGDMPLKGRKTPFMQDQLKAFKKYLGKVGYDGDASKLYALAEQCWRISRAKWDVAKSAADTRRGYSCPKAMADAYRNLTPAQVAAL